MELETRWKVWVGGARRVDYVRVFRERVSVPLGADVLYVLRNTVMGAKETETEFVVASARDLGLAGLPSISTLFEHAQTAFGLGMCSVEASAALIAERWDEVATTDANVAMERVSLEDGARAVLRIHRVEQTVSAWCCGNPDTTIVDLDDVWIWRRAS